MDKKLKHTIRGIWYLICKTNRWPTGEIINYTKVFKSCGVFLKSLLIFPSDNFYLVHLDHIQYISHEQFRQLICIVLLSMSIKLFSLDKLLVHTYIALHNHLFSHRQLTRLLIFFYGLCCDDHIISIFNISPILHMQLHSGDSC